MAQFNMSRPAYVGLGLALEWAYVGLLSKLPLSVHHIVGVWEGIND